MCNSEYLISNEEKDILLSIDDKKKYISFEISIDKLNLIAGEVGVIFFIEKDFSNGFELFFRNYKKTGYVIKKEEFFVQNGSLNLRNGDIDSYKHILLLTNYIAEYKSKEGLILDLEKQYPQFMEKWTFLRLKTLCDKKNIELASELYDMMYSAEPDAPIQESNE